MTELATDPIAARPALAGTGTTTPEGGEAPRVGRLIPLRSGGADQPTDAQLLDRCRERDPAAWDLLVGRYERLVYSVAVRNGLSCHDAADVTQTTFLTLIDSLGNLRDAHRLASWLMTVARRQSWRVRNAGRRDVPLDHVPDRVEDPWEDWDEVASMQDALAELGGPCRQLLQALYFDPDSPSYATIAEDLGRSVGGIGPMRGRCLEKLRAVLDEQVS